MSTRQQLEIKTRDTLTRGSQKYGVGEPLDRPAVLYSSTVGVIVATLAFLKNLAFGPSLQRPIEDQTIEKWGSGQLSTESAPLNESDHGNDTSSDARPTGGTVRPSHTTGLQSNGGAVPNLDTYQNNPRGSGSIGNTTPVQQLPITPIANDNPVPVVIGTTSGGGGAGGGGTVISTGSDVEDADMRNRNRAAVVSGAVIFDDLIVNAAIIISMTDLLQHASDPDGDRLIVQNLTASSGQITDNGDGTYRFVPVTGDLSDVTFSYSISDGKSVTLQTALLDLVQDKVHVIVGSDGDDVLTGTPGDDIVTAGGGSSIIRTHSGNDVVYAGPRGDIINTGDGDDLIFGGNGNDSIYSGAGNDIVYAGAGDDIVDGGDGDDSIFGEDGNDTISAGTGDDDVDGGDGIDDIALDDGNDTADGGSGDDVISGGQGHDEITGGDGNDSLWGGAKSEVTSCDDTHSTHSTTATDTGNNSGARTETALNENRFGTELLTTTSYAEMGDGAAQTSSSQSGCAAEVQSQCVPNSVDVSEHANPPSQPLAISNILEVETSTTAATVTNPATQSAVGATTEPEVDQSQGAEVSLLSSHDNADMSDDLTCKAESAEVINGNVEQDLGDHGDCGATTEDGNDRLIGGRGDDDVHGGSGDDRLIATHDDGNDVYDGGCGADTYDLSQTASAAVVNLQAGTASSAETGTDQIHNVENIVGSSSGDTFIASESRNTFTGGDGDDTFVYLNTECSAPDDDERDTIKGFEVGDRIDVSRIDADLNGEGRQKYEFIGESDHFNKVGELRYVHIEDESGVLTRVMGNNNDNLEEDFSVDIEGVHNLTADDFIGVWLNI